MSALPQHLVLGGEDALDGAHQGAALSGKIAVYFLLEIGFEKVATANGDAEGDDAFEGAAGGILMDGVAAVEASSLQEHAAQGGT